MFFPLVLLEATTILSLFLFPSDRRAVPSIFGECFRGVQGLASEHSRRRNGNGSKAPRGTDGGIPIHQAHRAGRARKMTAFPPSPERGSAQPLHLSWTLSVLRRETVMPYRVRACISTGTSVLATLTMLALADTSLVNAGLALPPRIHWPEAVQRNPADKRGLLGPAGC